MRSFVLWHRELLFAQHVVDFLVDFVLFCLGKDSVEFAEAYFSTFIPATQLNTFIPWVQKVPGLTRYHLTLAPIVTLIMMHFLKSASSYKIIVGVCELFFVLKTASSL